MNKHNKKQQILNKAIDLFAECGISKVSIAQIAKKVGASKGKVYYYFRDGKNDIIIEILHIFEDCVKNATPDSKDWESEDADAEKILYGLFFKFPTNDSLRLRKIVRIIMSEMYHNKQIAQYATEYFITGREKLLAECFTALMNNGKIIIIDAASAASYFNRMLVTYAIEDALRYPFIDDEVEAEEVQGRVVRDCSNFINHILGKDKITMNSV